MPLFLSQISPDILPLDRNATMDLIDDDDSNLNETQSNNQKVKAKKVTLFQFKAVTN